ncbi:hypothetical protein [Lysobacter capsici]|uniref:hypothetical protein n=1 Tax=Lysobacter capsici TaxID=435897 RepID=UPI00398D21ED
MKPVFIAVLLLAGCGLDNKQPAMNHEPLESALIVGSAESPDPVLAKVMALEKKRRGEGRGGAGVFPGADPPARAEESDRRTQCDAAVRRIALAGLGVGLPR